MDVTRAVTAAKSRRSGDKPATYECGRVCAADDCETRLSIYNPSPYCALHDHSRVKMTRPAGPKPVNERCCAYEKCGALFLTTNPKRTYCSTRCRSAISKQRRVRATSG